MVTCKTKVFEPMGCSVLLELTTQTLNGFTRVNPIAQNVDFFAAALGGAPKLGHKVVYVEGEMQFYYFDPRDNLFKPVSPEKLENQLRAMLARCAEEVPDSGNKLKLFVEFRSDRQTRTVVQRAKSILAADETFFSAESSNQRIKGIEAHEKLARVFVEQALERRPGQVLTLTDAYLKFCEYIRERDLPRIDRRQFKSVIAPLVRQQFDVALRNDLIAANQKQNCGWKDLQAIEPELAEQAG
jgi:hypothetical protein